MLAAMEKRENLALKPYLDCIKVTLNAALCVENFASQIVERHNKPEIEVGTSHELLLNPVTIHRSEQEYVMIETAVNSVRVSIKVSLQDAAHPAQNQITPLEKICLRAHDHVAQVKQLDELDAISTDGHMFGDELENNVPWESPVG